MAHVQMANGNMTQGGRGRGWWVWAVVFVLAMGVVTNVGVAWWCVYRATSTAPIDSGQLMIEISDDRQPASVRRMTWIGASTFEWTEKDGFPHSNLTFFVADPRMPVSVRRELHQCLAASGGMASEPTSVERELLAAGWPWLALVCDRSITSTRSGGLVGTERIRGGWVHESMTPLRGVALAFTYERVMFPYRPLWPGLIANTLLYGASWAAALWATIAVISWRAKVRRARRGRCGECGYDRRGLASAAVCPECGKGA